VITYAYVTDRGRQREVNEDFVCAQEVTTRDQGITRTWLLTAVADGVGGHQRGEWASENAVTVLTDELPALLNGSAPAAALRSAIAAANARTWREASRAGIDGSATTLVAGLIDDEDRAWLANVGDSRAYLVSGRRIRQLTRDHSWVGEEVEAGRMTPQEARESSRRNIITRSVGFGENVDVDVHGPFPLREGERIVLCSDGLYTLVSDEEIAAAARSLPPAEAAGALVALANERGGQDNISVVICSIDGPDGAPQRSPGAASLSPSSARFWAAALAVSILAIAGFISLALALALLS
jgi:protein phosphatase